MTHRNKAVTKRRLMAIREYVRSELESLKCLVDKVPDIDGRVGESRDSLRDAAKKTEDAINYLNDAING